LLELLLDALFGCRLDRDNGLLGLSLPFGVLPATEQHNAGISTSGLSPLTTENVVISMSLVLNLISDSSFDENSPTKRWKMDCSDTT